MLFRAVQACWGRICAFAADKRASVTVDFIVSIPILLAVLVLTTDYGRVLHMRNVLDNAVADATRYLTRAPLDGGGGFSQETRDIAADIISYRLNTPYLSIAQPQVTTVTTADGATLTMVSISAAVGVETPALGLANLGGGDRVRIDGVDLSQIQGFVITSSETFRHFGR